MAERRDDEMFSGIKTLFRIGVLFLPWPLKRRVLSMLFGYRLHKTSRIGFSWVYPESLVMEEHSRIGHFTVCKGLSLATLGRHASIGTLNWISAYPKSADLHYGAEIDRRNDLLMGEHSAITNRHLIDCTNLVSIGKFSTVAGYRSQILTHSINLSQNLQSSASVTIGNYCFIGTGSVFLPGSCLPSHSVLGAGSLLNKVFIGEYYLYAGIPAKPVKDLPKDAKYFSRSQGFVI